MVKLMPLLIKEKSKMKIPQLVQKYFIDIFFLIILLVIFLGGIIAPGNTAAEITIPGYSAPDGKINSVQLHG